MCSDACIDSFIQKDLSGTDYAHSTTLSMCKYTHTHIINKTHSQTHTSNTFEHLLQTRYYIRHQRSRINKTWALCPQSLQSNREITITGAKITFSIASSGCKKERIIHRQCSLNQLSSLSDIPYSLHYTGSVIGRPFACVSAPFHSHQPFWALPRGQQSVDNRYTHYFNYILNQYIN